MTAAGASIALGRDTRNRQVSISTAALLEHALIIGATGSGKTTTILTVLDGWMSSGGSVAVIDMKGDPVLAASLRDQAWRWQVGHAAWSLRAARAAWHPLAGRSPTDAAEMVLALAAARDGRGQVYRDAARGFLQLAFACWVEADGAPGFEDVQWVLAKPNRLEQVADACSDQTRDLVADALDDLRRDRTALDGVRTMAHRVGALARGAGPLAGLGTPRSDPLGREPAPAAVIDPRSVTKAPGVAVWSIAAGAAREGAAEAGTLALLDVLAAAVEDPDRATNPPLLLVIDEFSTLTSGGHGVEVIEPLARLRSLRVATLLATQTLADLRAVSPEFPLRVLGTIGTVIAHRVATRQDAEQIAALAGTRPGRQRTRTYRRQPVLVLGSRMVAHSASDRVADEYASHPNTLRSLGTGEAIAYRRGHSVRLHVQRHIGPGGDEVEQRA